jgi:hypothetical protein
MPFIKNHIPINFKDIVGNRYGRLIVIAKAEKRYDKTFWLCKCDCGNIKEIYGGSLTKKKKPTQSCGCLNKEYQVSKEKSKKLSKPRLPLGESGLNDVFRQYKDNVKNRKLKPIKFLLNKEEFKILTQ